MKIVRAAGLAGLVLAVGAVPVTAYALTAADRPGTPPGRAHATAAPTRPAELEESAEADDGPDHPAGTEQAAAASAAGRAHAAAMKAWAHCVAEAASGPKTPGSPIPPKLACGAKPVGPGRARHEADGATAPGKSEKHKSRGHGWSGGHGR